MEATIQNKMRLDKCDTYKVKETVGYRGKKTYMSVTRVAVKREEKQRDRRRNKLLETPNKEEK